MLNLKLTNSARCTGQQAPGILPPPPQHWDDGLHVASCVGAEDVDSSLRAYVASMLLAAISPALVKWFLVKSNGMKGFGKSVSRCHLWRVGVRTVNERDQRCHKAQWGSRKIVACCQAWGTFLHSQH